MEGYFLSVGNVKGINALLFVKNKSKDCVKFIG